MAAGCVYLVPVPIGNLGDITLRALETLKQVDLIAAEDTRSTRFLLDHYGIKPARLLSLHKYNEKQRLAEILALLDEGRSIAVVSDAGSPGISDPALILVKSAIDGGHQVSALPGATALIPALTASGLETKGFQFLGFLPLKQKERLSVLARIRDRDLTTVLYEAPHRVRRTLEDLLAVCGDRKICLARELTKIHEEFIRGSLSGILTDYQVKEKGEFVLIVSGSEGPAPMDGQDLERTVGAALAAGKSPKEIAQEASQRFGISRNNAYQLALRLRRPQE